MNAGAAAEEARLQREWFPEAVPGLFRVSKAEAAADLDVIQASLMRFQQQPQPPSAEAPIDRASKKSRLIEKIFRDAYVSSTTALHFAFHSLHLIFSLEHFH